MTRAESDRLNRFAEARRVLTDARQEALHTWGPRFIDLGRSEPMSAWPADADVDRSLAVGRTSRFYGPVQGQSDVRAAVAAHYTRLVGRRLTTHNVFVSQGALAGLTLALTAVCAPGDTVVVPRPYYHAHPSMVELLGRRVRTVPTGATGRWDAAALAATPADAVMFANPANPTGAVYARRHLDELVRALPPATAVIADEVYAEYVYEPAAFASLASVMDPRSATDWLVVRSASKTLGRPGLRAGVLIGPERVIRAVADRAAALTGAASLPAQRALVAGLAAAAEADHIRPYRRRLDLAIDACRRWGLTATVPHGTYFLWVDGPRVGSVRTAARLARDAGVFTWPGEYFGSPTHMRITLANPAGALETGLRRIGEYLTSAEE